MTRKEVYWLRTRQLTVVLLLLWVLVTYVATWFADELNQVSVLGFPVGFYMAAQGTLLVYLLIIWVYCRAMNKLDADFRARGKEGDVA